MIVLNVACAVDINGNRSNASGNSKNSMAKRKTWYNVGLRRRYLLFFLVGLLVGVFLTMFRKQYFPDMRFLPCGLAYLRQHGFLNQKHGQANSDKQHQQPNTHVKSNTIYKTDNKDLVTTKNTNLKPKAVDNSNFLLVGVMTAQKYMDTRAWTAYNTWVKTIPGTVLFFSREGSNSEHGLPVVALPGVDDSYPPQKKSFMMLKYMYDNYVDKYEWFMRVDDDIYIRGDRLERFLRSVNSSKPHFIGQAGIGTREELGRLSLDVDANFCMGGPGVVFSRETLRAVAENAPFCIKHFYSTHEDVEVGRCVRKYAGIPCTWAFEMQSLFYHNYREEKGSFTHDLRTKEVHNALTLHPIKQSAFVYRVHNYVLALQILDLRQQQRSLIEERAILDKFTSGDNDEMPDEKGKVRDTRDTRYIEPLNGNRMPEYETDQGIGVLAMGRQTQMITNNNEVLKWNFLSKDLYSASKENPRLGLVGPLRYALDGIVMQIMKLANKNARQRGRTLDYKEILYGYNRVHPLIGANYILDLLLVYRKHKGRKMTVHVRRHAYLHQPFSHIECTDDSESSISSSKKLSSSFKHSDKADSSKLVHFIMPLAGRDQAFARFIANFKHIFLGEAHENVALHVILFTSSDPSSDQRLIYLIHNVRDKYHLNMDVEKLDGPFSRGIGLEYGLRKLSNDSLVFFIDVDIQFTSDVLRRIRRNTIRGKSVYFPIVFSQYDPQLIPGCEDMQLGQRSCILSDTQNFSSAAGYWRQSGYGIAALYKSDFIHIGGFDRSIRGWGKEDVDLHQKFIKHNYTIFRSVDVSLVHVFHPVHCDPALEAAQFQMCIGSRASSISSLASLAEIIYKTPAIHHREKSKR